MQIRCTFLDISYLSETQKNTFYFLCELAHESLLLISYAQKAPLDAHADVSSGRKSSSTCTFIVHTL